MLLKFTETVSRKKIALILALLMLAAPAFFPAIVANAQRSRAAATPTPKKKTTPTPKKSQAKAKATPTPKNSKTNAKNSKPTTNSKTSKPTAKSNEKSKTGSKNKKATEKTKSNVKTATTKPKTDSKTSKTSKPSTPKTTTSKTTVKPTPKPSPKSTPKTEVKTDSSAPQIIVTTFSVPIKSQASGSSSTVTNAKLGSVFRVVDKTPAWYKVEYTSGGKTSTGWIAANSTNDMTSAKKTEVYSQIAERNYKQPMDFASASEFYDFATRVDGDLDSSDQAADLQLKKLLALRSALKDISPEQRASDPYKKFLKAQEKEVVYNEPAGQFLVAADRFWSLHEKYKKSAVSDRIAWEAANNPLPGECEGYVNCYLFDMRMRFGEYLNLHPNGKNAAEALKNLTDYLSPIVADSGTKQVYNGPTDVTDRAEFNNLLAELRTIVARLPFVEKEKALQQLKTLAEAYR